MATPFEYITGTISVANGIFTLATNIYKLKNVDDDLKVCLRLLVMISEDLNSARRLRNRKYHSHINPEIPDSLHDRANRAIKDLDIAAKKIGKSIEAVRVEKAVDNSISIAKRFNWVFNGKDNFIAQQWVVNAAHNRVLSIITSMESLPDVQGEMLAPPAYEEALLRSPSQIRALKGKSTAIVGSEREVTMGMFFSLCLRVQY